jgi:hypothetical protein
MLEFQGCPQFFSVSVFRLLCHVMGAICPSLHLSKLGEGVGVVGGAARKLTDVFGDFEPLLSVFIS